MDDATLWCTYTMLTNLESGFRSLKTDLELRPVYHQVERGGSTATIADAILDRIIQRTHRFTLTGVSLRVQRPETSRKEKKYRLIVTAAITI